MTETTTDRAEITGLEGNDMTEVTEQTAPDWRPQHYGREDRYAYSGLDIASGPDKTAWRCRCGKSGIVPDKVVCGQWGCPAKEFLT